MTDSSIPRSRNRGHIRAPMRPWVLQGTTCAEFWSDAFESFAGLGVFVERVMTDNAKNYVSSRAFQDALDGRVHKRIRPHRPPTNGKVERFNRTLTHEWA